MVAFITVTVLTFVCIAAVWAHGRRRPVGAPLSWGEAMAAATLLFFVMFFAYGVVPHQWLTWADNELNWRADRLLAGPGGVIEALPFDVTYQVVRDIIAVLIYVVFFGLQIALWVMWQNRGKAKPKEIETSPYGRPLVKKV